MAPGLIVQLPEGKPLNITLPVAMAQVGCVITPTAGIEGVLGCAFITTFADANDVHPIEFVTVKLCVPAARLVMVVLRPVPAIAPGLIIQFPTGNPFNTTLPVETEHVGCVIVPIAGAVGVAAVITTLAVAGEVQPTEFVTVKAYVPAAMPEMVLLAPVPAIAPGFIIQFPTGNPFRTTLPVDIAQVGCVIAPNVGAKGVGG